MLRTAQEIKVQANLFLPLGFDLPVRLRVHAFPVELVRPFVGILIEGLDYLPAAAPKTSPSSLKVFSRMEHALAY